MRIAASLSAALALPSGWRGIGAGAHGFSAAAGGAGIRTGEGGTVRVEPAHAVSIKAASAASVGLGIFPHNIGGADDDRVARGGAGVAAIERRGERHREAALLVGALPIGAVEIRRVRALLGRCRLLRAIPLRPRDIALAEHDDHNDGKDR